MRWAHDTGLAAVKLHARDLPIASVKQGQAADSHRVQSP